MPDPDLLVRTSGEYRISNYLLWELAYSELVFTDVLWPDFRTRAPLRRDRRVPAPRPPLRRHLNAAEPSRAAMVRNRTGDRGPGHPRGGELHSCDMPGLYRDEGVVLRTIKLGEADRIVTIFTQGHGKVRAVAKGVRKTTSRFGARLEPTSRVALQCYQGRELDVVTQAETLESNRALREEYALLTHAIPMLEAVDQVAQEREPNPALYRMLTGALARRSASCSNPLVTPAFFWKLLSLEGFHPMLDGCARCGDATRTATTPSWSRSISTRAARCAGRARAAAAGRSSTRRARLLRRMLGGGLNGVLAEPPGPATHEVEQLGIRRGRAPRRAPAALDRAPARRLTPAALDRGNGRASPTSLAPLWHRRPTRS